ncbi:LytTR family DNA-binding domain-containing protein [Brevundimonas sp.]|uniref:LytTR family DNA-binding domain-containing protein n=1 Tax=Brevundimonas sp. TaxID=1871086 RepID=UPI002D69287B|nr:LytTR family DNA-binding domain-containing protein [Brevundimonas sp.]HYC68094.1 LytTR family DNA-binding domain-containing protein [Brevundimonas sp.]
MTAASRPTRTDFLRGLAVAAAAGLFLALSGAFGTGEAGLARRLPYWVAVMIAGGLWGQLCALAVGRVIDLERRPWLASAAISLAIALPGTLLVWAATGLFFFGALPPAGRIAGFLLPVLLVTAAMTTLNLFLARGRPMITHAAPPGRPPARFPQRLPARLRGAAIHAVQAEDHYLRVHTDRGSDLILMRLTDALEELEGLDGARTHRSWWVAREAVTGVSRGDGRALLTLTGGLQVPVSRRHARGLRAAGWY